MRQMRKGAGAGALAAGLPLALCTLLLPSPAGAIVAGERVAIGDAPWAAGLRTQPERGAGWFQQCSAPVIGPRRVATARHCVEHDDVWRGRVMVGSDDPDRRPGPTVAISRVWVTELFDWSSATSLDRAGDVAVIETER